MKKRSVALHAAVISLYAALAVAYTWPLARHFSTLFLGNGDITTGSWNIWHFRHAVLSGQNPLWTDYQYWPYGANLVLHHYTLFYDVIGFFLLPKLGLAATYNTISLFTLALAGWGTFLLCRDWGASAPASFLAGGLFAFGPGSVQVLEAIACLDYSCTHVLPFFLWRFTKALRTRTLKDCLWAALCLSWVWLSNYYYFMFCLLLAAFLYLWRERPLRVELSRRRVSAGLPYAVIALGSILLVFALSRGQREFHGRGGAKELLLYVAPYLGFWAVAALALSLRWKARPRLDLRSVSWISLSPYLATFSLWAAMNLPFIVCILFFWKSGDLAAPLKPWRGGGSPTEPAWMFLPSYYHLWWGDAMRRLGSHLNLGYLSGGAYTSASLGLIPLVAAYWLWRQKPRDPDVRLWYAGAAFSFMMTLGPSLKLFGVNLYLPLPFYFIHLLPFFNGMQTGMRFHVFIMLFLCLIFAAAYDALKKNLPARRASFLFAAVFGLLALENLPRLTKIPLPVSPILWRLRDRPEGAVLRVPVGAIFNGLSNQGSLGHFFDPIYETVHEKPIVGGYLTRVSRRVYDAMMGDPFLQAIVVAQDGGPVAPVLRDKRAPRALRDARIRYVLLEPGLPVPLRAALRRWPMRLIDREGEEELYEVTVHHS